jgi:hypothetical protein
MFSKKESIMDRKDIIMMTAEELKRVQGEEGLHSSKGSSMETIRQGGWG